MNKSIWMEIAVCVVLLVAVSGNLCAGEKKLMHCFAFTAVEGASEADWQAFFKATDALPGKIPGLSKVWYGKLQAPLAQFSTGAETRKELAGGAKTAKGEVSRVVRQWGVCMEMKDATTLKAYTDNAAHKEWDAVYAKVRVAGTTTYNILGQ